MLKKQIDVFDYAGHICKALKPNGVLLTTSSNGFVNTMTIGWGTLGVDWSRPMFIAYVRKSRYTHLMLQENPEFTVNIPIGEVDKHILGICGSRSGRDMDKIASLGLHLVPSDVVCVPGIQELPLTLECKVLYTQDQELSGIPEDILSRYYPDGDEHTVYYGQIVNAYIIQA